MCTIVYQDNESAIRLEKNGRRSCSQRTRHIDIRYFYIKDLVDKGIISIKHCPTELMIADFFTKPLQGALFYRMRDVVMGNISVHKFLNSYEEKEYVEDSLSSHKLEIEKENKTEEFNEGTGTGTKRVAWAEIVKGTHTET